MVKITADALKNPSDPMFDSSWTISTGRNSKRSSKEKSEVQKTDEQEQKTDRPAPRR